MVEEILNQIKKKEDELSSLKAQLEQEGLKDYSFLIGKYYCLAATCFIKIIHIEYVDDYGVSVECIKIQGGNHDAGRINVDPYESYELKFIDIYDQRITEVSKEKFVSFLDEALNMTKSSIIEMIS